MHFDGNSVMANKRRRSIMPAVLTILAIGILANHLLAQTDFQNVQKGYVSEIYAEAFAFKSDSSGKGRLDVYIQVPYSEIKFVKEGEQYTGRIELSASAVTLDKQEIWQISRIVELHLKDIAQTASQRLSSITQFSADLNPGKYELNLQLKDSETKNITVINKTITIKDFSIDSLAVSDLMLVNRLDFDENQKNIVPNLTGVIAKEANDFYFFFEVYCKSQLDSIQLLCTFTNQQKHIITRRTKSEILTGNRTQIIWRIDTPSLVIDQYVFLIEAAGYSKTYPGVIVHASSSRPCLVKLKDLPSTITDFEKATDQLQYFAQKSDITFIREAVSQEEKQKRFLEFWAKHDPDPKTPRNELMEEYYSRVAYANKKFSQYMEGWKTDRGMVYIRFGPPQSIDHQPFNIERKGYEIWYYYDKNRKFIFIDETGFGDYRLQYLGSDLWGRIR
jgi:GWxTD domain-containing protein